MKRQRYETPLKAKVELQPMCPICKKPAKHYKGSDLHPQNLGVADRMFWACLPCDTAVICHRAGEMIDFGFGRMVSDGTTPTGTLAQKIVRSHRASLHRTYDHIWQEDESWKRFVGKTNSAKTIKSRREVFYRWLATAMDIPHRECHVSLFDLSRCRRANFVLRDWEIKND